jgi:hypothetical protein
MSHAARSLTPLGTRPGGRRAARDSQAYGKLTETPAPVTAHQVMPRTGLSTPGTRCGIVSQVPYSPRRPRLPACT